MSAMSAMSAMQCLQKCFPYLVGNLGSAGFSLLGLSKKPKAKGHDKEEGKKEAFEIHLGRDASQVIIQA